MRMVKSSSSRGPTPRSSRRTAGVSSIAASTSSGEMALTVIGAENGRSTLLGAAAAPQIVLRDSSLVDEIVLVGADLFRAELREVLQPVHAREPRRRFDGGPKI